MNNKWAKFQKYQAIIRHRTQQTLRRELFRQKFYQRTRDLRNQQIDKLRNMLEGNNEIKSYEEFKNALLKEGNPDMLIAMNDLDEQLREIQSEIEHEMLLQQGQSHQEDDEQLINTVLETHLVNNCKACNNLIEFGDLCSDCCDAFSDKNNPG